MLSTVIINQICQQRVSWSIAGCVSLPSKVCHFAEESDILCGARSVTLLDKVTYFTAESLDFISHVIVCTISVGGV